MSSNLFSTFPCFCQHLFVKLANIGKNYVQVSCFVWDYAPKKSSKGTFENKIFCKGKLRIDDHMVCKTYRIIHRLSVFNVRKVSSGFQYILLILAPTLGLGRQLNSLSNSNIFKGDRQLKMGFCSQILVFSESIQLVYPADIRSEAWADSKMVGLNTELSSLSNGSIFKEDHRKNI